MAKSEERGSMNLTNGSDCHLTYCTNIHPGENWSEVRANLNHYLPAVKNRVSPEASLGVGLRLSAIASAELREKEALDEFRAFLDTNDLYVFTINGFPYGEFHGVPVKQHVYRPDWRTEERLAYTNQLADLLVELLASTPLACGSISTVPGGFRPDINTSTDIERMTQMLICHVAHLVQLERQTGVHISLALEPEPYCFIETVDEALAFFETHLFSKAACDQLANLAGFGYKEAERALRHHLGLCLDLCHAAVEYEDPLACVDRISQAGIMISKMQISAGLRIPVVTQKTGDMLLPFDDPIYLHQVVERSQGGLRRFLDLPDALKTLNTKDEHREWRVHFHVPIFLDDLGEFSTTQSFVRDVLSRHRKQPVSTHLEVETYTWDVLPDSYRTSDVVTAITRELQWAKAQLV